MAATRPAFLGAALAVGRTVMRTVDALEGGAAFAAITTARLMRTVDD